LLLTKAIVADRLRKTDELYDPFVAVWKVERFFAWLHNFRRLVTRWEYKESNFLGMLQLACILILMRR
jgi:transposase